MSEPRGHWRSNTGFILAATGSAIGLGNLWKFPFITWENNGGAFVPRIPRVHCRRGPAHHDGRTTDRAGDAKERGRGAQGGHGPGVGLRWPLGRVLRISSAQLLHGDRGLVALLLRQVHGLDGRWIPGGCLDGRSVR